MAANWHKKDGRVALRPMAGSGQASLQRQAPGTSFLGTTRQIRVDKIMLRAKLKVMKVSLPLALEKFVSSQVKSGEFDHADDVVCEALRWYRDDRESKAMEKMRSAFAGVDAVGGKGEPTARDRAQIGRLIASHRSGKRLA